MKYLYKVIVAIGTDVYKYQTQISVEPIWQLINVFEDEGRMLLVFRKEE